MHWKLKHSESKTIKGYHKEVIVRNLSLKGIQFLIWFFIAVWCRKSDQISGYQWFYSFSNLQTLQIYEAFISDWLEKAYEEEKRENDFENEHFCIDSRLKKRDDFKKALTYQCVGGKFPYFDFTFRNSLFSLLFWTSNLKDLIDLGYYRFSRIILTCSACCWFVRAYNWLSARYWILRKQALTCWSIL